MKKDYVLNTIAGLINAAEAVIMSMIITRTTGLTDAGYVTIAFAIGNLLMTIGKYGVYEFQVTDHNYEYPFYTYFKTRIITTFAMLICLLGYITYSNAMLYYTQNKIYIVLFIGLIYVVEAFEDLIKAQYQYIGKLYIGALMFIIRWCAIIISFGISIILTHNTAISLAISLAISIITFAICYYIFSNKYKLIPQSYNNNYNPKCYHYNMVKQLLKSCFPLFLSSFLSFYIINSSKYALDRYMDAETQAQYGFVSMPVFTIGLLNSFIYQPQLISLTEDFTRNIARFRSRITRQYLIILFITTVCIIGGYIIGIPILSLLYHTDLINYKHEMLILLFGGGLLAVSGYQNAILTIMRRQRCLLFGYTPVSLIALIFVGPIVNKYNTMGAAFSYLSLILSLCIIYEFFIRKELVNAS